MSLVEAYLSGADLEPSGGSYYVLDGDVGGITKSTRSRRSLTGGTWNAAANLAPEETRRHGSDKGKKVYLARRLAADTQIKEWLHPPAEALKAPTPPTPKRPEEEHLHSFLTGFQGGVVAHVTPGSIKMRAAPRLVNADLSDMGFDIE